MTTLRAQHPLAFAVGVLIGAVMADLFLIGGEVLGYALWWRAER